MISFNFGINHIQLSSLDLFPSHSSLFRPNSPLFWFNYSPLFPLNYSIFGFYPPLFGPNSTYLD